MKNNKSQFFSTREETSRWLKSYDIKNYTINDDLSVNVNGYVYISYRKLKAIPVKFGNVTGSFWCNKNQLINLIGSPGAVGGSFNCNDNKLTNLAGAPGSVGGNFYCGGNPLISLAEMINCNFEQMFYFNIDKENFKQKELIQILKKYYNSELELYELKNRQFYDTIKPQIEKKNLQQKLVNSRRKNEAKPSFI